MNTISRSIRIALAASAACVLTQPAWAQDAPGTAAQAEDQDNGEIVVTAQRREERLVDVPIAVSAIDTGTLERADVTSVANIGTAIPNIQINQTVGNTFGPLISIRGLAPSADTSLARDQPVGIYIDGVPIGKSTGAAFDTVDLQRVEVLRGPQGTLYGKNTIGGAVNLITRGPSGEFGGSLTLGAGEFGRYTQRLVVDLPAVGDFKAKVAVSARQNQGFYRNNFNGTHFGEEEMVAARADLVWEPSSNFRAAYAYDITDSKGLPAILAISAGGSVPVTSAFIAGHVYTSRPENGISAQSALASDFRVNGHALTLEYDAGSGALGEVVLKSITARRTMHSYSASDFDGTPNDLLRIILQNDYEQFTQEFQIIGTGSQFKYTLGGFFLSDNYDVYNPRWNFQFGGDRYDLSRRGGESKSYAVYGQLTWSPSDSLDITVGGRWTKEEKQAYELLLSNTNYAANPNAANSGVFQRGAGGVPITRSGQPPAGARPGAGGIGPSDLIPMENSDSWSQFNPELNLVYKVNPNWSFYGRVATGFKSGGINDTAATNSAFLTPYDPEHLLSFELGSKFSTPDRRFNLNVAVYHSIYKDFQAGVFVPAVVTTNIINAGEAQFTGFEIEGSVRPVDGLTLTYGFGYVDARYTDFVLPDGTNVTNTYKIPLSPKFNYLLGAVHRLPLGFATLETSLNYSWRDEQYSSINGDPLSMRKAYGLLDGRISLKDIELGRGAALEFAVWGKNLLDEEYWVSGINLSTFTVRQWGDPRSFGAEARLRF
jgi:iron complex outermembrane receptor protein